MLGLWEIIVSHMDIHDPALMKLFSIVRTHWREMKRKYDLSIHSSIHLFLELGFWWQHVKPLEATCCFISGNIGVRGIIGNGKAK